MKLEFLLILTSAFAYTPRKYRSSESESNSSEYDYSIEYVVNEVIPLDLRGTLRKSFAIHMALTNPNVNAVCSPISALLPLGKLVLGAEKKGRSELLAAIGFKESEVASKFSSLVEDLTYLAGVTLTIASKIYVSINDKLRPKFDEESRHIFQSSIEKVDFSSPAKAAASINEWMNRHTNGMIPSIITPGGISMHTSIILVNAIYFDAEWKNPFRKVNLEPFYSQGNYKDVYMMSRSGGYKYVKSKSLRCKIIEIPYKMDQASMVIVLPKSSKGLQKLLNELKNDPEKLNNAMARMKTKSVSLKIPKFKISTELDLRVLYEKINLNRIFRDNSDLTKIVDGKTVTVSKAIQKTIINVAELGTEAAAGSAMILPVSLTLFTQKFHANRPFLFFVMSNRQQLFAGIFNNKKG